MIFGRRKAPRRQLDTLVGPHTEVQGGLRFSGGVHVDGKVQGNVTAAGDKSFALLSVGENGVIDGDVHAPMIVLNGLVHGDVHAERKVSLSATARVVGNVHYRVIEMESGATVEGKLIREGVRPGSTGAEDVSPNPPAAPQSKG